MLCSLLRLSCRKISFSQIKQKKLNKMHNISIVPKINTKIYHYKNLNLVNLFLIRGSGPSHPDFVYVFCTYNYICKSNIKFNIAPVIGTLKSTSYKNFDLNLIGSCM